MQKKDNKKLIITAIAIGQLILALAVTIYGSFQHFLTNREGDLLIAFALFVFWVLMDIVEPIILKRFEGISQEQKSAYVKFIVFDFAGLAGIAYFLYCMGNAGNSGIMGAVIYAFSIKLKRDNQEIFYNGVPEEEASEEGGANQTVSDEADREEELSEESGTNQAISGEVNEKEP